MLKMLDRCSRTSLFHRFHGYCDREVYAGLLRGHLDSGASLLAWQGPACIGMATLAPAGGGVVDLGVLVEDAWQRRGVGTRLVATAIRLARTNGAAGLHADVLADDVFIVHALRRAGPVNVRIDSGTFSIDLDLT